MYYRSCDESGKRILALYPASSEKKVVTYTQKTWWDYAKMNPLEFGRDFDFSRTFVEQFADLKKDVPRPSLHNTNVENAEFGNHCVGNKDCYMTIGSDLCEGCQFTYWAIRCRDCLDCSLVYDCELCYDCVDLRLCYNCQHVDSSESMTDSQYCYDCVGCFDCFGCVELRHKKCCFLNQQLTKGEYETHVRFVQENPAAMQEFLLEYEKLLRSSVLAGVKNVQSENVRGDKLWRCRECFDGFDLEKCHDASYCSFGFDGVTSQDVDFFGQIERLYNGFSAFGQYDCISTIMCHYSHDVHYSEYCISSHHALGCVSLHHHAYCILNKQYTKEQYEELFPRIIEHMKNTGEWGEFFPVELSPFPYNVTVAQKYYPLTKEEIEKRGWYYEDISELEKRHREEFKTEMTSLPADTTKIDASICSQVLRCERSGHPYKITPKLFSYLRDRRLPLPCLHQDERNEIRMARRNPQQLWQTLCTGCHRQTDSSFHPDTGQRVYCPSCYEKFVYGSSEKLHAVAA
jgi:CxxC-x17-CxxC domain-containing protein